MPGGKSGNPKRRRWNPIIGAAHFWPRINRGSQLARATVVAVPGELALVGRLPFSGNELPAADQAHRTPALPAFFSRNGSSRAARM
jgi:hypothetical protein